MTLPSNMAAKTFSKRIRRCSCAFVPAAAPAGITTPSTQKHGFLTGCCCVLHTPWKLFWIGKRKDIFVRLQVCCRVYGRAAEHWEKILCYFTDALGLYTVRPPCSINVNQHAFFWGGNIRSACSGGLRGPSPRQKLPLIWRGRSGADGGPAGKDVPTRWGIQMCRWIFLPFGGEREAFLKSSGFWDLQPQRNIPNRAATAITRSTWTVQLRDTHRGDTNQTPPIVDAMTSSPISQTGYIWAPLGPFRFKELKPVSWLAWHPHSGVQSGPVSQGNILAPDWIMTLHIW